MSQRAAPCFFRWCVTLGGYWDSIHDLEIKQTLVNTPDFDVHHTTAKFAYGGLLLGMYWLVHGDDCG